MVKNWSSYITSLSICFWSMSLFAQAPKSISAKADAIYADKLGMLFVLEGSKLSKYDQSGKYCCNYDSKQYGKPSVVGTSNPLKTLLFYPDFQKVILLGSLMGEIRVIDLSAIGLGLFSVCTFARDQNLWLYDPSSMKLMKINESGTILYQSESLNIILQKSITPNFVLESENLLFVNDPDQGIFLFDQYGVYYKTIAVKGLKDFQVIGEEIYYFSAQRFHSVNTKTLIEKTFELPYGPDLKDVKIGPSRVYLLETDRVVLSGQP